MSSGPPRRALTRGHYRRPEAPRSTGPGRGRCALRPGLTREGSLDIEYAERAAAVGPDAVALSNHGGRQLDWTVAPLDLLPEARCAAGGRLAILADGGIRRGADIAKALALGADAVLVGRAALY